MNQTTPIHGELQHQIMSALWRLSEASVQQVRAELPPAHRGAYTTVQTVLNRLAERGLLTRHKRGRSLTYRPAMTEAEYLSKTLQHTLSGATPQARRGALAALLGSIPPDPHQA